MRACRAARALRRSRACAACTCVAYRSRAAAIHAIAHGGPQLQDLDGRLRDPSRDSVRERLFAPSVEDRGQAGPRTQPDVARRVVRPPPSDTRASRPAASTAPRRGRASNAFAAPGSSSTVVSSRRAAELSARRAARERRQKLVERVAHELGVRRDVGDVVALVLGRRHRVVEARRGSDRTSRRRTSAAVRRPRSSSRTRPRCRWPAGATRGAGCTRPRSRRCCRRGAAAPRCARTVPSVCAPRSPGTDGNRRDGSKSDGSDRSASTSGGAVSRSPCGIVAERSVDLRHRSVGIRHRAASACESLRRRRR